MKEKRYMISEASKKVEVESHVLRYWEEELELDILRNEMGHRYYTEEDIQIFQNVKELKEQGFQLKAIKMLIPELKSSDKDKMDSLFILKEELNRKSEEDNIRNELKETEERGLVSSVERLQSSEREAEVRMEQFKKILGECIGEALKENTPVLGKEVSSRVSDNVIKEMDYLFRVRDEQEEDRYKKLDETIRNYQKTRQEIAASKTEEKKKKGIKNIFRRE